jgi:nitrate/nitrite transport system substrate-binding protein
VNASADVIDARLMGDYSLGGKLGEKTFVDDMMLFHRGGEANFPRLGHGVWFMTQYQRFGRLTTTPNYNEIAQKVILQDLYKEVAAEMEVPVPTDDMQPFMVDADKGMFDPNQPDAMLGQYAAAAAAAGGLA